MVVFTCNHCGDSIQKPKAEKHYETKCRNNYPNLCCVDCLKDFRGEEFRGHTKCVSEAERYGGKGFVARPSQNKGEKKQNAWIEIVQGVLRDNRRLSGPLRSLLERISQQPNTPRKKPKFFNFVRSMEKKASTKDIEAAWDLLAFRLGQLSSGGATTQGKGDKGKENMDGHGAGTKATETELRGGGDTPPEPCTPDEEDKAPPTGQQLSKKEMKQLKKKSKLEAQLKEIQSTHPPTPEPEGGAAKRGKRRSEEGSGEPPSKRVKGDPAKEFDWTGTIATVLGSRGREISVKKLQKKVLSQYCAENEAADLTDRVYKRYTKSLHKAPNIKIENDKVFLIREQ